MLGGSCSSCCASCEDSVLSSGLAFPSVSVAWSTSGFSSGESVSGGGASYGRVTANRQFYNRTLYEFTVNGAFYESGGSELLLPGTKPFTTTQTGTGYVPFAAYVKTWPAVLTNNPSVRVNPYVAVRFRCGTQSSPFSSGNYLWAAGYVNLPVFTSTWQYTQTWANSREPWTLVKNYATSETGDVPATIYSSGTLNTFYAGPLSNDYYASLASPNDTWSNDNPSDYYGQSNGRSYTSGNLLIYTTSKPATLPTFPNLGFSTTFNKYAEAGEVAGYEVINVFVPPTHYRYVYINMETPYTLCGEFNNGQYSLYKNTVLTNNIYGATDATSSSFSPQVSRSWEYGPNAARMPWFTKPTRFSNSVMPEWRQSLTSFGIAQNPSSGSAIVIQVAGPPAEGYGNFFPTLPGASYSANLRQGPSIAITLNPA